MTKLRKVGATDARVHFGEMMRRIVALGEHVLVERGGSPQVVIMSVDDYRNLVEQAKQAEGAETLARAAALRARIARRRNGEPVKAPEDLVREAREVRDDESSDLR